MVKIRLHKMLLSDYGSTLLASLPGNVEKRVLVTGFISVSPLLNVSSMVIPLPIKLLNFYVSAVEVFDLKTLRKKVYCSEQAISPFLTEFFTHMENSLPS